MKLTVSLTIDQAITLRETMLLRRDALVKQQNLLHITEDEKELDSKTIANLSDILLQFGN